MQNFKYVYYKSLNLMHVTLFSGAPGVIHNAHSSYKHGLRLFGLLNVA